MEEKKVTLKLDNVSKSFAKIENDEVTHALNEVDLTLHSGGNHICRWETSHQAISGTRHGIPETDLIPMAHC